jgi:NAD-dependent dihydropyrimidine dehydrogenase PreA subunit
MQGSLISWSSATKDASCVEACPVDCIHPTPGETDFEAAEQLYIDPEERIDSDACVEALSGRRRHIRRAGSTRMAWLHRTQTLPATPSRTARCRSGRVTTPIAATAARGMPGDDAVSAAASGPRSQAAQTSSGAPTAARCLCAVLVIIER